MSSLRRQFVPGDILRAVSTVPINVRSIETKKVVKDYYRDIKRLSFPLDVCLPSGYSVFYVLEEYFQNYFANDTLENSWSVGDSIRARITDTISHVGQKALDVQFLTPSKDDSLIRSLAPGLRLRNDRPVVVQFSVNFGTRDTQTVLAIDNRSSKEAVQYGPLVEISRSASEVEVVLDPDKLSLVDDLEIQKFYYTLPALETKKDSSGQTVSVPLQETMSLKPLGDVQTGTTKAMVGVRRISLVEHINVKYRSGPVYQEETTVSGVLVSSGYVYPEENLKIDISPYITDNRSKMKLYGWNVFTIELYRNTFDLYINGDLVISEGYYLTGPNDLPHYAGIFRVGGYASTLSSRLYTQILSRGILYIDNVTAYSIKPEYRWLPTFDSLEEPVEGATCPIILPNTLSPWTAYPDFPIKPIYEIIDEALNNQDILSTTYVTGAVPCNGYIESVEFDYDPNNLGNVGFTLEYNGDCTINKVYWTEGIRQLRTDTVYYESGNLTAIVVDPYDGIGTAFNIATDSKINVAHQTWSIDAMDYGAMIGYLRQVESTLYTFAHDGINKLNNEASFYENGLVDKVYWFEGPTMLRLDTYNYDKESDPWQLIDVSYYYYGDPNPSVRADDGCLLVEVDDVQFKPDSNGAINYSNKTPNKYISTNSNIRNIDDYGLIKIGPTDDLIRHTSKVNIELTNDGKIYVNSWLDSRMDIIPFDYDNRNLTLMAILATNDKEKTPLINKIYFEFED